MDVLRQQGKILYVGSSNFAGWHIAKAKEARHRRGSLGLVSEQCHYNLLARTVELEVLPACQDYGLGVIPWSPLAGGLLGGVLRKIDKGRSATERMVTELEKHRDKIEQYEEFCDELGEDPAHVGAGLAAAPAGGHRRRSSARARMEQLDGTMRALEIKLDEQALARLDEIFPGHRGPRRRTTPGSQPPSRAPTTTIRTRRPSTVGSSQERERSTVRSLVPCRRCQRPFVE